MNSFIRSIVCVALVGSLVSGCEDHIKRGGKEAEKQWKHQAKKIDSCDAKNLTGLKKYMIKNAPSDDSCYTEGFVEKVNAMFYKEMNKCEYGNDNVITCDEKWKGKDEPNCRNFKPHRFCCDHKGKCDDEGLKHCTRKHCCAGEDMDSQHHHDAHAYYYHNSNQHYHATDGTVYYYYGTDGNIVVPVESSVPAPSAAPSEAPVEPPVESSVPAPSAAPSAAPSEAPVELPVLCDSVYGVKCPQSTFNTKEYCCRKGSNCNAESTCSEEKCCKSVVPHIACDWEGQGITCGAGFFNNRADCCNDVNCFSAPQCSYETCCVVESTCATFVCNPNTINSDVLCCPQGSNCGDNVPTCALTTCCLTIMH